MMKEIKGLALFIMAFLCGPVMLFGQNPAEPDSTVIPTLEITPDDPVVAAIDSMLASEFFRFYCFSTDTGILNHCLYPPERVPEFPDSVYKRRLELLDRETPMDLSYNNLVRDYIRLYADKRRELASKALGLSRLYFPMFEEMLDRYDIPYEMKYLAIVESALNPTAKSRAGAMGLWQFM